MSTTPNKRVTEAHRATAQAALEEAGIPVESVADEFNTNPEHWNLKHCRKALRKAGYSATEAEEALAEADTAPLPPASDDAPKEEAAVDAADLPDEVPHEEGGEADEESTDAQPQSFSFKADVAEIDDDSYTLNVDNGRESRFFSFLHSDIRYEGDDVTALQEGYCGIDFTISPDVAEAFGLAAFLSDSTHTATEVESPDAPPLPPTAETARPDTDGQPRTRPYRHKLRTETISAYVKLTPEEMVECGKRMSAAMESRAKNKETASYYSGLARAAEKEAYKAMEAFDAGEEERRITCDVIGDYNAGQLVFVESEWPHREVRRMPMSEQDRRHLLLPFDEQPANDVPASAATDNADAPAVEAEPDTAPISVEAHDAPPPARECFTCAHNMTRVELYPCAGCSLNPEAGHTGDDDRWSAKDGQEVAAPVDEAGDAAMPTADEHAESDDAGDEDDLAADTLEDAPEDMGADLPAVPPLSPSEDLHDLTQ